MLNAAPFYLNYSIDHLHGCHPGSACVHAELVHVHINQ